MLGVQRRRPSLYDLVDHMQRLTVPTLIVTGDEDEPCLEPGLLMKRSIATSGLVVIPNSGHTINLEEPDLFNRACDDFFHHVEAWRWPTRDPRAAAAERGAAIEQLGSECDVRQDQPGHSAERIHRCAGSAEGRRRPRTGSRRQPGVHDPRAGQLRAPTEGRARGAADGVVPVVA